LIQRVHPLGQVMEGLAVLRERLSNPETTQRGVRFRLRAGETAEPAMPGVIESVLSQGVMDLIHQMKSQPEKAVLMGGVVERKPVAHRERIRPEVAVGWRILG